MRNNCIVLSQHDIEAVSILDLGRILVGDILECDAKLETEIICEFLTNEPSL